MAKNVCLDQFGNGLPNITVELHTVGTTTNPLYTLTTDANGKWDITSVVENNYDIKFSGSVILGGSYWEYNRFIVKGTHEARTDNPHSTTAAQVGALTPAGGTITGNLDITGNLVVSGTTTFEQTHLITTNLVVNGNSSLGNQFSDLTTVTGNLIVSGTIFGGGIVIADEKVKISSTDILGGYLENKLTAGTGVTIEQVNAGGNLSMVVSLYVSPTVTLSGGSSNETGSTVTNVALSWICDKTMTTRLLSAPVPIGDRDQGAGQNGSYTHTGANLTTNTTYTITVGDGTNTSTGTTTVAFYYKKYYGNQANSTLTDPQIIALATSALASSRATTFSQTCANEYIYVCYPASWGTASFKINGLTSTAWTLVTRTFVNASGNSSSYNIYRTDNLLTGTYDIIVS